MTEAIYLYLCRLIKQLIMSLLDFFNKNIGMDAGSEHLRLSYNGKLVFDELAEIRVDEVSGKITAIGDEVLLKTTGKVVHPVKSVISDFHGFEYLLRGAIRKSLDNGKLFAPALTMYMAIPSNTTEVEKRAYKDSGEHAGAKEVILLHQCVSSAIGLGILLDKKNFTLIDFGASKIEITVFINSIPIAIGEIRVGTRRLKTALGNYINRNYGKTATEGELENILVNWGRIGAKVRIGITEIETSKLREVIDGYLYVIEDYLQETMEQAKSHRNFSKVISNGIYFTGGGSIIEWIVERVSLRLKMKSTVSSTPRMDNINGIIQVISQPELYSTNFML
jgi:rod shape-determining protein MreB